MERVAALLVLVLTLGGCASAPPRSREVVYSVEPRTIIVSDIGTLTIVLSMMHDCVRTEPGVWVGFGGREAIRLTYAGPGVTEAMGCGR